MFSVLSEIEVIGSCGLVSEPHIVFWDVALCSLVDRYKLVGKPAFPILGEFADLWM